MGGIGYQLRLGCRYLDRLVTAGSGSAVESRTIPARESAAETHCQRRGDHVPGLGSMLLPGKIGFADERLAL
jgi:hypothetical protein